MGCPFCRRLQGVLKSSLYRERERTEGWGRIVTKSKTSKKQTKKKKKKREREGGGGKDRGES